MNHTPEIARLYIEKLEKKLQSIQELVDEQKADDGLWLRPTHIFERYMQSALKDLHRRIEA